MGKRLTEHQIWTLLNSPDESDAWLAESIGASISTVRNNRWRLRREPWTCKVDYQPCRWCGETMTVQVRVRNTHAYHARCRPLARAEVQRAIDATRELQPEKVESFHKWHADTQAESLSKAQNRGAKWNEEEDAIVLAWIERPIMETASELSRTYMAVNGRRRTLKRRFLPRQHKSQSTH